MTNDELNLTMNELIGKVDAQIADLKSIKNYIHDTMCVDVLRSIRSKRNEIFNDWCKFLQFEMKKFAMFDITAYKNTQEKSINDLDKTLEYLHTRKPIRKPYNDLN